MFEFFTFDSIFVQVFNNVFIERLLILELLLSLRVYYLKHTTHFIFS